LRPLARHAPLYPVSGLRSRPPRPDLHPVASTWDRTESGLLSQRRDSTLESRGTRLSSLLCLDSSSCAVCLHAVRYNVQSDDHTSEVYRFEPQTRRRSQQRHVRIALTHRYSPLTPLPLCRRPLCQSGCSMCTGETAFRPHFLPSSRRPRAGALLAGAHLAQHVDGSPSQRSLHCGPPNPTAYPRCACLDPCHARLGDPGLGDPGLGDPRLGDPRLAEAHASRRLTP
jgi:hypothetical protein